MNDREAIHALVTELYALVSGPGERKRDWRREAELFLPGARMIRTVVDGDGVARPEFISAAVYPENFERKMEGRDFFEFGINNIIEQFGQIAHVFSSYEAWEDAAQTKFIKRGINSIQLYRIDGQWRIAGMVWDDERPGLVMDERYRGADPVGDTRDG